MGLRSKKNAAVTGGLVHVLKVLDEGVHLVTVPDHDLGGDGVVFDLRALGEDVVLLAGVVLPQTIFAPVALRRAASV